ncbi:MAG TPA: RDD family protein [Candidatus Limnocylindrales bacterium]
MAPGPGPGVEYAPHGGRLVAYIIDGFIVGIAVTIVALVLTPFLIAGASSENAGALAATGFLYVFVVLLVSVSYFPFFWARNGQTPGMKIFGLRVVRDADGGKISGGTAIIRLIGLWISFAIFYLGIIWILVDSRRRGWHDLLAGTVVIRQP